MRSQETKYFLVMIIYDSHPQDIIDDYCANAGHKTASRLEFFIVCTKLPDIALLASKDLTTTKKLPSVGLDPKQEVINCFGVQSLTNSVKNCTISCDI